MDASRETVLKILRRHEGGYVDDPDDPGGPTNKGITKRVYDAFRITKGLKPKSVRFISDAEVDEIYERQYFDPIQYDRLPLGLGYAIADFGVNSGVSRSVKELQRLLVARGAEIRVDGNLGLNTLKAIDTVADVEGFITQFIRARMAFLKRLKGWRKFGKGWTKRVMGAHDGFQENDNGVIDFAIAMARGGTAPALPKKRTAKDDGIAKAVDSDIAVSRTAGGAGTIAATAGMAGTAMREAADQIHGLGLDGWIGDAANAAFLALTVLGVGLLTYSWFKRMHERGAI